MQDVNGLSAPGYVYHAVGACRIGHTNLFDALADDGHRLEIVGLMASLDPVQLITCIMPRVRGKSRKRLSESPRKRTGRIS